MENNRLARNQVSDRKAFDPNAFYAEHHNEMNMGNEILSGNFYCLKCNNILKNLCRPS